MRLRENGFTLIEIVVSLSIFLIIVVGAFSVLSASNVGTLESFPTAFGAGRAAKDITAASVYLQAFQEYAAGAGSAQAGPTPTIYQCTPSGATWSCTPALPAGLSGGPQPSSVLPYQLAWTNMQIVVERWNWDTGTLKYSSAATATTDSLVRVKSTLTWKAGNVQRTLTVERFIP